MPASEPGDAARQESRGSGTRVKTPKQPLRLPYALLAVGLGWMYWELAAWLVGHAAAISAPGFAVPWVRENPWAGQLVLGFATFVPAWIAAAIPVAIVFLGWRPEHVLKGTLIAAFTCLGCLAFNFADSVAAVRPTLDVREWLFQLSLLTPNLVGSLMLPLMAGGLFARRLQAG